MIESIHGWVTTPAVCNTCGKKLQVVYETDVIIDNGKGIWKLPVGFKCDCGSEDITYTDFE